MSGGFWLGRRDGDFENPGQREMPWHVVISGFVRAGAEVAVGSGASYARFPGQEISVV